MSREVVTTPYSHNHLISLVMLDRQSQPLMRTDVRRREIWEWRDHTPVRGFAGILYEGLNGAPPTAIVATPNDLYQQLGLHKVLSPLRLRGLTALLSRMKRNAHELAEAA